MLLFWSPLAFHFYIPLEINVWIHPDTEYMLLILNYLDLWKRYQMEQRILRPSTNWAWFKYPQCKKQPWWSVLEEGFWIPTKLNCTLEGRARGEFPYSNQYGGKLFTSSSKREKVRYIITTQMADKLWNCSIEWMGGALLSDVEEELSQFVNFIYDTSSETIHHLDLSIFWTSLRLMEIPLLDALCNKAK